MSSHFLILGSGRVAQHFWHYLTLLKLPARRWSRQLEKQPGAEFLSLVSEVTHVLVLVNDQAIEPLIEKAQAVMKEASIDPSKKTWLHFSGALQTPLAFGCHPLMTFPADAKYTLETYQRIPFVIDQGAPDSNKLLPGLPNVTYRIDPKKRALYHALCVMSGNFSAMLWQKFFATLEKDLLIPPKAGLPYFEAITENIKRNPNTAVTGPLTRGDHKTLDKNLSALRDDPFEPVFRAFIEAYQRGSKP